MTTISDAQLAANQANSKLSTGPKTPAGKPKIRLNSVTHGYSSHTVVIPEHEKAAFLTHWGKQQSTLFLPHPLPCTKTLTGSESVS